MQHTAAVRLPCSAARSWRATWMPGQPCAQFSGTYCVSRILCSFGPTPGCARRPENLGGHTAIAFHPSSDWMRRLARSVITGESNSRVAPVVVVLGVVVFILLCGCCSSSSSFSRARGRRYLPRLKSADVPRPAILTQTVRRQWRAAVSCPGLPCLTTRSICGIETAPISVRLALRGETPPEATARKGCVFVSLLPGGLWISLFSGIRGARPSPF